jgi:class 3 adenylate cyclase
VRPFQRLRGQVHGRRRARLFRLSQAHEDDAERAVRAARELIAAVSALKAPASLQTRVGIATGLDLIGSGEARERGIVGETPNLAARLQGIAEPNMVVIAESTRKLLGNLFELDDLGAKNLKGIAGPVRVLRGRSRRHEILPPKPRHGLQLYRIKGGIYCKPRNCSQYRLETTIL